MSPPVEHPEKLLKSKLTRLTFALSALHITFAPSGARSLEARFRYVMDLGGKRERIEKAACADEGHQYAHRISTEVARAWCHAALIDLRGLQRVCQFPGSLRTDLIEFQIKTLQC